MSDNKSNIPISVTIIVSCALLAFAYVFVEVYKGENAKQKEKQQIEFLKNEADKAEKEDKAQKIAYNQCMKHADDIYHQNWELNCKHSGKDPDCNLPTYTARDIEFARDKSYNQCMQLYKSKTFDVSDLDLDELE